MQKPQLHRNFSTLPPAPLNNLIKMLLCNKRTPNISWLIFFFFSLGISSSLQQTQAPTEPKYLGTTQNQQGFFFQLGSNPQNSFPHLENTFTNFLGDSSLFLDKLKSGLTSFPQAPGLFDGTSTPAGNVNNNSPLQFWLQVPGFTTSDNSFAGRTEESSRPRLESTTLRRIIVERIGDV